ncbi:hypothetical protein KVG29_04325 [Caldicoprobacter algeriensis]|uniref:hypothetical protein n=1 Tax=Caldicoprobacter algeriensis TaxID=699281 RepID=UPI0020795B95|nr:hypothetical protein [Caldicoprobacter algeriensis]MCM8900453.1 hypothetical protein [Caldicoprobacter algeriensis]
MRAENVAMSRIEEQAGRVDRALKGLVLYRQLRHEPAVQAFEDFVAGLVSDGVCAGRLWDDYNRFVRGPTWRWWNALRPDAGSRWTPML